MIVFILTGIAGITNFTAVCPDWHEWMPERGNKLKYEYRVRPLGNKRSLLFYYGDIPSGQPALFPVGNYKANFSAECMLRIIDSLEDFFQISVMVQVSGRCMFYVNDMLIFGVFSKYLKLTVHHMNMAYTKKER